MDTLPGTEPCFVCATDVEELIPPRQRVCIIGAGAAGLVTLKRFFDEEAYADAKVVLYERSPTVGGTWVYSEKPGPPVDVAHPPSLPQYESTTSPPSPIYPFLRTNLALPSMALHDLPIPTTDSLFPPHPIILRYLEDYTAEYDLLPHIHLSTTVTRLERREEGGWDVEITPADRDPSIETFDAVVICNGHNSNPRLPSIEGMSEFAQAYPKRITHSKDYRHPEGFTAKSVLTVGDGPSAWDISRDVHTTARHVHRATRRTPNNPNPKYTYHPEVERINPITVHFADGTSIPTPDHIILCTGYRYSFPFYPSLTDGSCVPHLYRQLIHADHPSLALVGLSSHVAPFPLFEYQALYLASIWSATVPLPCRVCRQADSITERDGHVLGPEGQVNYCDAIVRECGDRILPPVSASWKDWRARGPELRLKELGY